MTKDQMQFDPQSMIDELRRERNGERRNTEEMRGRYIQALEHLQSCRQYSEDLVHKVERLKQELVSLREKIEGLEHDLEEKVGE